MYLRGGASGDIGGGGRRMRWRPGLAAAPPLLATACAPLFLSPCREQHRMQRRAAWLTRGRRGCPALDRRAGRSWRGSGCAHCAQCGSPSRCPARPSRRQGPQRPAASGHPPAEDLQQGRMHTAPRLKDGGGAARVLRRQPRQTDGGGGVLPVHSTDRSAKAAWSACWSGEGPEPEQGNPKLEGCAAPQAASTVHNQRYKRQRARRRGGERGGRSEHQYRGHDKAFEGCHGCFQWGK